MTLTEKIVRIAKELASTGSSDLTITEVARLVGVSRQTIYKHVGGLRNLKERIQSELEYSLIPDEAADTRERLLAAAGRVFSKQGYEHSTLDEVAIDAGLTKGAVYWHFSSKQDLFIALMEGKFRQQQSVAMQSIRTFPLEGDADEALASIVAEQFRKCEEDPTWPHLWLEFLSQRQDPNLRARLAEFHRSVRSVQSQLMKELQDRGYIPSGIDSSKLAALFDVFSTGIMISWLIDPVATSPTDLGSVMVQFFLNGIKGEQSFGSSNS